MLRNTVCGWKRSNIMKLNVALCYCRAGGWWKSSLVWAARFRRLARDYERLVATLAGYHWLAFVMLMLQPFLAKSA
jgi:hypothetical protein